MRFWRRASNIRPLGAETCRDFRFVRRRAFRLGLRFGRNVGQAKTRRKQRREGGAGTVNEPAFAGSSRLLNP